MSRKEEKVGPQGQTGRKIGNWDGRKRKGGKEGQRWELEDKVNFEGSLANPPRALDGAEKRRINGKKGGG